MPMELTGSAFKAEAIDADFESIRLAPQFDRQISYEEISAEIPIFGEALKDRRRMVAEEGLEPPTRGL
jgi:hypothetical protein